MDAGNSPGPTAAVKARVIGILEEKGIAHESLQIGD